MSLLACTLLASVRFQHLFNTILSLVGYMGHNYARKGGKITPSFLQCNNYTCDCVPGFTGTNCKSKFYSNTSNTTSVVTNGADTLYLQAPFFM